MNTILHCLAEWADAAPNSGAQSYKIGNEWKTISAREYCDRVYWLALYLESQGMVAQNVGGIFSYNCPEWIQSELAIMLIGGMSSGIYPNSMQKDIQYTLNHSESRFLFIQNKDYFNKIKTDTELLSRLKVIIVFDGDTSISPKAVSYDSAIAQGKKLAASQNAKKLSDFLSALDPQSGAFLIYTSGTTGVPKGAILTHDNLLCTVTYIAKNWHAEVNQSHVLFSFLPLSHVAETLYSVGTGILLNARVAFASKFDNVSKELPEVQPTILLCVPRVWEKMMEGVLSKVEESPITRKHLANWALDVGVKTGNALLFGGTISLVDQIQLMLADRLVLSKIRSALGLKNYKICVSGAAPLQAHVCQWFRSIGVEVREAYGQTESTGMNCMTVPGIDSIGTVGRPVPGLVEMKIANDGEILAKGRHVFKGYLKNEEATAQTLENGWLHTGDLGEFDSRGFLKIKGRKKEVLKTSGGKMVAPLPIEETLKAAPIISQVCMVGDGKKFLSALITLTETKLKQLSKISVTLEKKVITDISVIAEVKNYIDQLNSSLPSYEQIKKFAVLSKEFSIAEGEMTPTLKMKRSVIETRYKDIIDQFYN